MKIGILGAGHIRQALVRLLAEAGHDVAISNSRGPYTRRDLADRLGHGVTAYSSEDAARFGELIIETVPFDHYNGLPTAQLAGKIVIDTADYHPDRDGQIDLDGLSERAFMPLHLGSARVAKAFNAIPAANLESQRDVDKPLAERNAAPFPWPAMMRRLKRWSAD